MHTVPHQFYDDPIEVFFKEAPTREKSPHCPDGFIWRGEEYRIIEILEEWIDYRRRGRMARNMAPTHLASASRLGSWGVGRFFFRVKTTCGRAFELYYDRAPEDADNRKGNWFLKGERTKKE